MQLQCAVVKMLAIASALLTSEMCRGLKIAAFNIQTFGPTKMRNSIVVDKLVQVKQLINCYAYL